MKRIYEGLCAACIGISVGVLISLIISILTNTVFNGTTQEFTQQFADPNQGVVLSMLVYAGLGVFSYLISFLYKNEKLGLTIVSIIHLVLSVTLLLSAGIYLHWFTLSLNEVFGFILFVIIIWLIIWLSFYFYYKAKVKKYNQMLKKR